MTLMLSLVHVRGGTHQSSVKFVPPLVAFNLALSYLNLFRGKGAIWMGDTDPNNFLGSVSSSSKGRGSTPADFLKPAVPNPRDGRFLPAAQKNKELT